MSGEKHPIREFPMTYLGGDQTALADRAQLPGVMLLAFGLIAICMIAPGSPSALTQTLLSHGDNDSYVAMTAAVRALDLDAAGPTKFAWGLPFSAALIATALRISNVAAVATVSILSALVATYLVFRLWGPWVAAYFTVADFRWIELSAFGGSEPLSLALLFGALLAARSSRWPMAAILVALSACVRPAGVLLLPLIGIWALRESGLRTAIMTGIGSCAILALYFLPLAICFHDPLVGYHGYQQVDWDGGAPITCPLGAVLANLRNGEYFSNPPAELLEAGYIFLHVAALILVACSPRLRQRASSNSLELGFALVYSAFILCYNSPHWAASIYARMLLPIFPFFLWVFERSLPKTWPSIIAIGLVSAAMAMHSAGLFQLGGTPGTVEHLRSAAPVTFIAATDGASNIRYAFRFGTRTGKSGEIAVRSTLCCILLPHPSNGSSINFHDSAENRMVPSSAINPEDGTRSIAI